MSKEQEPPYEPKEKIQSHCWNCNQIVRSSMENTTNHVYTKQPWFTHTRLRCLDENCAVVTILFHDTIKPREQQIALQYPTSILEFLDNDEVWEEIQEIRGKSVGAHEVIPHDLIPRQRSYVEHWGEFLQRVTIDDTDFGGGDAA